jgi:uncharacterized protein YhfF
MTRRTAATDAFWNEFIAHSGRLAESHVVVAFGDSPAMATELADLVVAGTKRATASLLRDYDAGGEALPRVGDFVLVVDGEEKPRCIWRTTRVDIKPLIAVDDAFAWEEGEGDRSREGWLEGHRGYFRRQAAREGFAMHDAIETVFERFEVVWPPAIADRGKPGER